MITLNTRSRLGRAILRLWTPQAEHRRAVRVGIDGGVSLAPGIRFSLPPAGPTPGQSSPPARAGRSGQSS